MIIQKAILSINPDAEFTTRDNQIEWHNGTTPISKSEIEAMIPIVEQEIINKKEQEIANKQSALNKLKALGLNDAEINSILGK
jgi:ABC-type lipoprotein release transport system permease subunit